MRKEIIIPLTIIALLFLSACKPKVKSGYVEVPTVTQNALSGVYSFAPKSPKAKLYYEEAGKGEPLILLHGNGVDRRMWDDIFFKLAKKYRVIRYDLRGYGKSDMPEVGLGYLHADDLKNFMDAMGIEKANIAGVSLGGITLAEFVALYPERVITATISSGALCNYPDRSKAPERALKFYNDTIFTMKCQEARKNKLKGITEIRRERLGAMKSISGKHYRQIRKKLYMMVKDWSGWQVMYPETDPFIGSEADSLLAIQKTHPPILFLIGQYDYPDSKKSMQRMASICPGSQIQLMTEAGHFTAMECPKEFMKKMTAFIDRNSSKHKNIVGMK